MDAFGTYDAKPLEDEFFPSATHAAEFGIFLDGGAERVADVEVDTSRHTVADIDFADDYVNRLEELEVSDRYLELEDAEKAVYSAYSETVEPAPDYPSDLGFVEEAERALEDYGLELQI
ncbi:MAG: hypothetical protein ABEI58_03645 [Candidatus Nanohaloarchaea archaeon]